VGEKSTSWQVPPTNVVLKRNKVHLLTLSS
jgi:hypothetical protein